ncbi:hypothetical protein HDU91_003294, partial [Kappamyces sp. JEL0680]
LVENLKDRGIYSKLEAAIRWHLFQGIAGQGSQEPASLKTRETVLLNELVREYLAWQGYSHTLSCLEAEAQLPKMPAIKSELAHELGVNERLLPPQL